MERSALSLDRGSRIWDRTTLLQARILRMSEKPKFHSMMIKDGRWTVAVRTGYGPVSHVPNFATEERQTAGLRRNRKTGPTQLINQSEPRMPRDPNFAKSNLLTVPCGRPRGAGAVLSFERGCGPSEGSWPRSPVELPMNSGHRCIRDRLRTGCLRQPRQQRRPSSQSPSKRITLRNFSGVVGLNLDEARRFLSVPNTVSRAADNERDDRSRARGSFNLIV